MTSRKLSALLRKLGACKEARKFAEMKTLTEAWSTCERGDWLLWIAARMVGQHGWPTHQQIVLAACTCAETALQYVSKGEDRPRIAIETARRWAIGEATLDEVRADAAAAYAAYADVAYADAAAVYAAYADSTYAAYADVAYADAAAVYAAYADSTYAAYAANSNANSNMELSDIVRRELNLNTESL
jgi:hypothetical protein